jgi:hypothetical protein
MLIFIITSFKIKAIFLFIKTEFKVNGRLTNKLIHIKGDLGNTEYRNNSTTDIFLPKSAWIYETEIFTCASSISEDEWITDYTDFSYRKHNKIPLIKLMNQ